MDIEDVEDDSLKYGLRMDEEGKDNTLKVFYLSLSYSASDIWSMNIEI